MDGGTTAGEERSDVAAPARRRGHAPRRIEPHASAPAAPAGSAHLAEADGLPLVVLRGALDAAAVPSLGPVLAEAVGDGRRSVLLDASAVTSLDAEAIAAIATAVARVARRDGGLRVVTASVAARKAIARSGLAEAVALEGAVDASLESHLDLPAGDPTSASRSRRWARAALAAADVAPGTADDVVLLVSEVVTNAVRHAGTAAQACLLVDDTCIHVEVADGDPTLPTERAPDDGGPSGRGILLVAAMAARWGAHPTTDGKVVWFDVAR